MENLLSAGLRFGCTVEVQYSVTGGKSSAQQVWWPARVEKVQLVQDRRGSMLTALLKFQALHGFPAALEQVLFQPDSMLRDKEGVQLRWRFPVAENSSDDPDPSSKSSEQGEEDMTDELYDPEMGGEGKSKRKGSSVGNDKRKIEIHSQQRGDLNRIERNLGVLERQISKQRRELRLLREKLGEGMHGKDGGYESCVPIDVLRLRLRPFLEKCPSVQARVSATELRTGLAYYSQELVRKSCDCTMMQFDQVLELVRSKPSRRCIVEPDVESLQKNPRSEVRLQFRSLRDLLSMFCEVTTVTMEDVVVKTRVERGSSSVSAMRILGVLLQSEGDEAVPLHVVVGSGIVGEFAKEENTTFYRNNTGWNEVDCMFESPMCLIRKKGADILKEVSSAEGEDQVRRYMKKNAFAMTWRNDSHPDLERVLARIPAAETVLGTLEVSIPCVLIRGASNCEEMLALKEANKNLLETL